jgi:hypothetical protein
MTARLWLRVTPERECGRQPTEPAADNEDRALSDHIGFTSSSLSSAFAAVETESPTGARWK